jgi:DNA-binding MarR family transcriptional regulator
MTPPAGWTAHELLEYEVSVLLRRARGLSGALARSVHPELDAAAYGLMVRIDDLGAVRITDLADYFNVGKPTVSRQIALLESLGLVSRSMNDGDARSRHLSLTDEGRARLRQAREARRDSLQRALIEWTTADIAALADLLHRFNATA